MRTTTLYRILFAYALAAVAPVAHAQYGYFADLVNFIITTILNPLVPVLFGLAMIVFLWGVVKFLTAAGDAHAQAEGRTFIIYGIIGLVVMFGVWAFVNLITGTFGYTVGIPQFN